VCFDDQVHVHTRVYDVDRWPNWQKVLPGGIPQPLWGGTEPLVALGGVADGVTLHHPSGRRVQASKAWLPGHRADRSGVNVQGRPLVALVDLAGKTAAPSQANPSLNPSLVSPNPMGVMYATGGRTDGTISVYGTSNANLPHAVAPALAEGRTYVIVTGGGQCGVMWFDGVNRGDGAQDAGARYFPSNTVLVHDCGGFRCRALGYSLEGLRIAAIEDGEPQPRTSTWNDHYACVVNLDGMDFDLGCAGHTPKTPDELALVDALKAMSELERERWIAGFQERHRADVHGQFQLATAMSHLGDVQRAIAMLNDLNERHPDHARSRYSAAWTAAAEGRWADVWTLLDGVAADRFSPDEAQHLAHMLGIAGLRTGRWDEGAVMLRRAASLEGGACNLHAPLAVIDTVDGIEPPETMNDTRTYFLLRAGKVVRSIRAADAHLVAGDHAAAIEDLDHSTVWRAEEVQGASRLAEANPASGRAGFAAWLGVAGVLGARYALSRRQGHDLPLGDRSWDEVRLAEVEARAAAWLYAFGEEG